jgi:hypothetical protein
MPQPSRPPTRRPPPRPARPASPRGAPAGGSAPTDFTPYLRWGGALVLTLIIVAAGFGLCAQSEKLLAFVNTIVNPPPKITPLQIITHIRSASELTTVIVEAEAITKVEQENARILGFIPNKPTELIYKGHSDVRAGFDLTQITEDSITIQGQQVILTLPPPQILSKGLDADKSGIYDLDRPWLGELDENTVNTAQQETIKLIMEQVCAQGILDKANQNAEVEFARLLSALAFEEVEVITQSGDCK